jgi:N-sulfoglucosamine sulfohydrolase
MKNKQSSRRNFLKTTSLITASSFMFNSKLFAGQSDRPNIIWVLSEDMCADIGCYGTPVVQTPNLDKMASEGLRFTNAFTSAPVCSASRSAMITGMYQTSIGAHNHRSQRKGSLGGDETYQPSYALPEPIKPFTHYLRQAGYYCVNQKGILGDATGSGKTDFNFQLEEKAFDGADWAERQPDQPFFAQISIKLTHRGGHWKNMDEKVPNRVDPSLVKLPAYLPDHPVARKDWADYLDSIQWMDQWMGALRQRLETEGILENTVIIFIGDHGRCEVRGKQWCHDSGLWIPLIVRWPQKFQPAVKDDLVNAIDITHSILKLAGAKPPKHLQGRDFLASNPKQPKQVFGARDRCDETIETIRTVRDKRYRYIRNYMWFRPYMAANRYKDTSYPIRNLLRELDAKGELTPEQKYWMAPQKPFEELYDLVNDPDEVRNLASLHEYQNKISKMRSAHYDWMYKSRDLGLIPEPILEDMGREYGSKMAVLKEKKNRKMVRKIVELVEDGVQGPENGDKIAKALNDKQDAVRFWAAMCLGNFGELAKDKLPVLSAALNDPCESVQIAAARALYKMGEKEKAMASLLKAMNSTNHAVRHYAALFIEDIWNDVKENVKNEKYQLVQRVLDRIIVK